MLGVHSQPGLASVCLSNHQHNVASFTVNSLSFSQGGGGGVGGPNTPYQRFGVSPEKILATYQCKNIILKILVKPYI
jgi:hypothetical protein